MKEKLLKVRDIKISVLRSERREEYIVTITDSFDEETVFSLSGKLALDFLESMQNFETVISNKES
jgi:hypothetical protein